MLQNLRYGVRMLLKNPGVILIIFSLLISSPAPGQQSKGLVEKEPLTFAELRKLVQELDKRLQAVRERGNTLTVLDALRALENEYAARGAAAHAALASRILTLAPEMGNYGEALRYADLAYGAHAMGRRAGADELKGFRPVAALEALARAAAAAQVVMINEAHHVPQHRAFTVELLKRLRRQGFTHFAAETLYAADTQLNERGYPTAQTGFYTAEPVHGELIRSALRLGYRVVPYEAEAVTNADERERGQARNLIERILKSDQQARILIHAGYAHIDEKGADRVGAVTMAQRFKEATGIDPFTIDQTEMTEHSAPDYEHPLYRHVQSQRLVSQPMVFRNAQGRLWALETGRHDVTLFHPRSRYTDGRPDWLRLGGDRKPYRLPKQVCGAAARCLVRARALGEAADAIPIDQLEISANRQASLLLPVGEFNLEVQDPEGKTIRNFRVSRRRSQ
ncbi:MAG: hypothetical protein ACREBD_02690 [Blastocatellia bacterium]